MWKRTNGRKHGRQKQTNFIKPFIEQLSRLKVLRFLGKKQVKQYITVSVSAVVIGLIFGFIILSLLNDVGQQNGVDAIEMTPVNKAAKNTTGEESVTHDLPQVKAYLVQGGVFSTEDNAYTWIDEFRQAGFPSVLWEDDGMYFVFFGAHSHEEELGELKNLIEDAGFEAYIKEWQTEGRSLTLDEDGVKWLDTFVAVLNEGLSESSDLESKIRNLITLDSGTWPQVGELKEKTDDLLKEESLNSNPAIQYGLLKMWSSFNDIILDGE